MTPQEKTRLDNFKGQYNSIVSNISIKNKELERILERTTQVKGDLGSLSREIKKGNEGLKIVRSSTKAIEDIHSVEERRLEERGRLLGQQESSLDFLQKELSAEKIEREIEADTYIAEKKQDLNMVKAVLLSKESELDGIKHEIDSSQNVLDGVAENLNEMLEEKRGQEVLLDQRIGGLTEKLEKVQGLLSFGREELDIVTEELAKARGRIMMPDNMLKERGKVLERKERNFEILILRWKKFFKEHFPGQELRL